MQTATSIQVSQSTVADTNTIIPGTSKLKFSSFGIPSIEQGNVVFYGADGPNIGIYYQSVDSLADSEKSATLNVVCDLSSNLPTIGNPSIIDQNPVIDGNTICFRASNGITQGVFAFNMTTSEIGELTTCPASEELSNISASNGMVVFQKQKAVNVSDNGIWLIQKNNLTKLLISDSAHTPVQILGNPMNPNNYLSATGRPYLDGENVIFVGQLTNSPTGNTEDALISYGITSKGLLSILRKGDQLPSGKQVAGDHPFQSGLSYKDGNIAFNVEYNDNDTASTKYMMILIDSQYTISEITTSDTINPVPGVSIYTSSFERSPMTSAGKVCFASGVELTSDVPSVNLFGNLFGELGSYIEGYTYPYKGINYLQNISFGGNSLEENTVTARCFWNNGQSDNEDNLGIYLFAIAQS